MPVDSAYGNPERVQKPVDCAHGNRATVRATFRGQRASAKCNNVRGFRAVTGPSVALWPRYVTLPVFRAFLLMRMAAGIGYDACECPSKCPGGYCPRGFPSASLHLPENW